MYGRVSIICMRERVNPIFSSVLSQNSKLLVIAQLHPRSTEHLMSNIHLHNTIQHAFAALMQVQTSHLCMMILSRTSCTHHHHQRRRQWIIFAVPTETKLGSTTFRFGSEHQRKMSSIRGSMISHERVNPIFSSVLSQNSKLLVIAQLHPRSTEHLMSNIHLHNTLQHAFSQQFASPGATCA